MIYLNPQGMTHEGSRETVVVVVVAAAAHPGGVPVFLLPWRRATLHTTNPLFGDHLVNTVVVLLLSIVQG